MMRRLIRGVAVLLGAGCLASASGGVAQAAKTTGKATPITTQSVLDGIRHAIMPCDPREGCNKKLYHNNMAFIHPDSASLYPDAGGFSNSCREIDTIYEFYGLTEGGVSFKTCDSNLSFPASLKSYAGEYQGPLNQMGLRVEKSIGLDYLETVNHISGNRSRITFAFACTTYAGTPMNGVQEITLQRTYKTTKRRVVEQRGTRRIVKWLKVRTQYSLATYTRCPTRENGTPIADIASARSGTEVLHERVTVKLQPLMDEIHNYLPTDDYRHYTGSRGPTTAWLKPGSGGFTTNCHHSVTPNVWYPYKDFSIYSNGTDWDNCPGSFFYPKYMIVPPYDEYSKPTEFARDLTHIGNQVLTAAHIKTSQTTASATLNRTLGTITYTLPTSTSTSPRVEKITLTQHRGYTTAAITILK